MVDGDADHYSGQPNAQGAFTAELFHSTESAHECLLNHVLRVDGVTCRGHRNLEKKRAVLVCGRFEVNFEQACRHRGRFHPVRPVKGTRARWERFNYLLLAIRFLSPSSFFLTASI